ncbi:PolI-like B DNA polymerase [Artemisia annua]|uniref:PolI-like B DNA polymerase n=1 Tax=Artemisia annua TaxID=35608 RepID=A0A2U1L9B0_ARTAN|nr:PolI-like B DNA polymerase [Artemisia annua]
MARNFRKFLRRGGKFRRGNHFGNNGDRHNRNRLEEVVVMRVEVAKLGIGVVSDGVEKVAGSVPTMCLMKAFTQVKIESFLRNYYECVLIVRMQMLKLHPGFRCAFLTKVGRVFVLEKLMLNIAHRRKWCVEYEMNASDIRGIGESSSSAANEATQNGDSSVFEDEIKRDASIVQIPYFRKERHNLMNQPALVKDRYKIRQAFITAPGNSLMVADYGQLLEALEAGGDLHSRTAMNMYPYIRDAIEGKEVLLESHPQPGQESPPVYLLKRAEVTLSGSFAYVQVLSCTWAQKVKSTLERSYKKATSDLFLLHIDCNKWRSKRRKLNSSLAALMYVSTQLLFPTLRVIGQFWASSSNFTCDNSIVGISSTFQGCRSSKSNTVKNYDDILRIFQSAPKLEIQGAFRSAIIDNSGGQFVHEGGEGDANADTIPPIKPKCSGF